MPHSSLHGHTGLLVLLLLCCHSSIVNSWGVEPKAPNPAKELSSEQSKKLAQLDHSLLELDVKQFLGIGNRVVDTKGLRKARKYITQALKQLGRDWHIEYDTFNDKTPYGRKVFSNIIATLNPDATRRLVISAHYDSKYYKDKEFHGAVDSAVPCMLMIDLARSLQPYLSEAQDNNDVTLQLVFFDGEEAFVEWTRTDSTYGARHLAQKWENTAHPSGDKTLLESMDVLVLLDLLGSKNPNIRNSFPAATGHLHRQFQLIQQRLHDGNEPRFFTDDQPGRVEDDHIPFLERSVPVLHVIPVPFPDVWHKPTDHIGAIDMPTVFEWANLLRVFTAEYLGLNVETD